MNPKINYHILCFKGYRGEGAQNAFLFAHKLEEAKIEYISERVPKSFVDKYILGKEGDSGYCTLGLIFTPENIGKVKDMLAKEKSNHVICNVKKGDVLEELIEHWDSIFKK
jgi:hypothetical protein